DANKYNPPIDKIKSVYENNPDVKYRVLDDKLMNFLIENAKVKEVERKDFNSESEAADDQQVVTEEKPKKPKKKKE
ncbi:MAG: hypothetical protein IT281_03845, partial [Ignavibacteria bacterium]|nr:hypothetical protein [Ignavibacteria bacterium]